VLVEHPEVVAGVGDELLAMLGDLASFERPKKVALLGEELTVENGLMTPTLKVKRRQLEQRFAALIDSLYEDEAADKTAR
jgi:long-chain acyl-CoA synthetase